MSLTFQSCDPRQQPHHHAEADHLWVSRTHDSSITSDHPLIQGEPGPPLRIGLGCRHTPVGDPIGRCVDPICSQTSPPGCSLRVCTALFVLLPPRRVYPADYRFPGVHSCHFGPPRVFTVSWTPPAGVLG